MNKTQTARFESWYKHFPNKVSVGAGEKAFEKLDPDDDLTKTMVLAVQAQIRYRAECKKTGVFCPNWKGPGPWITQKCWRDEIGSHAELKEKAAAKKCHCGNDCPCEKHFYDTLRDDWRWQLVNQEWRRLGKPKTQRECIEALRKEGKLNLLLLIKKPAGKRGGNPTILGDI